MKILLQIVSIVLACSSFAAEYHVKTTGDDVTGDGSLSNPWGTPYAAERLISGDVLYLHEGTYNINGGVVTGVQVVSGTTISGVDGEDMPYLDTGVSPTGPTFFLSAVSNVTLSGMKIKGEIWIANASSYINIEDNEIYGGGQQTDSFGCLIYLNDPGTGDHSNITIRNNYLHDNYDNGDRSYNNPILQLYDTDNITIEYNTFENAVEAAIRLKDDQSNVVIRYNFFLNSGGPDIMGGAQDDDGAGVVDIYQNIMVGANGAVRLASIAPEHYSSDWQIYNNTFIGPVSAIGDGIGTTNINAWNNIIYNPTQYFIRATYASYINYLDYNQYYDTGGGASWMWSNINYSNLGLFQASSNRDANSVTDDPGFVNPSGTTPDDFKRFAYPNDGRGGAYNDVTGAYVTGGETIGFRSNNQPTAKRLRLSGNGPIKWVTTE